MLHRAFQAASILLAAAGLVLAAPAGAIIGGQADGSGHPYVGAVDVQPAGPPVPASGTLISPTVFLTAGHVTTFFDRAGITRARVTFDPVVSNSSTWYTGTVHTNPAYDRTRTDDRNDLGVIVFDAPIPGITPASLPTQGLLDELGTKALSGQTFTTVGYGVSRFLGGPNSSGVPHPDVTSAGTRNLAELSFLSLTPGWLRLQQHVDGRMCFGDSGAPSLLGDSDLVVGIVITDANLTLCESDVWEMRLDTPAHRAFLGQYVALP